MTVTADFSVAYRYVVAFIRGFLDEGYEVLNSRGMIEHAQDLHYHAQKILESIKLIPLATRLEGMTQESEVKEQIMNLILEESHDQTATAKKELVTKKLTVRMTPTDNKRLADLAKKTGVYRVSC